MTTLPDPLNKFRGDTLKIPSKDAFVFKAPTVPTVPRLGWQQLGTGKRSGAGTPRGGAATQRTVAVLTPSIPRLHTPRIALTPQLLPEGSDMGSNQNHATDKSAKDKDEEQQYRTAASHTMYSSLENQIRSNSPSEYRSVVIDCEAIIAQLRAAEGEGSTLETAVSCLIMAKIINSCFEKFGPLLNKLMRTMLRGVYEDFDINVPQGTPLMDVNYMALSSFRDRHAAVLAEAQERETRATNLLNALQSKSNAVNSALRRWQKTWLSRVFHAWRSYSSNQKERDDRFVAYIRRLENNRQKRYGFLMWIRFTVSHSRNKLMRQSYTSHRKLLEQIDELKVQCDSKDHELIKFRQSRDKQLKRMDTVEEAYQIEKTEAAKARSRAIELDDENTVLHTMVTELISKYEGNVRTRMCVLHPVLQLPREVSLGSSLLQWMNSVFHPHPTVKDLSRDLSSGDVFLVVMTVIAGKKIIVPPQATAVDKIRTVLEHIQSDVYPPPPSHLIVSSRPESVAQGHRDAIHALCLCIMHGFVIATQRTPLFDAINLTDTVGIPQQLDSIKDYHTRLKGWENVFTTLADTFNKDNRRALCKPNEVVFSSLSYSNFVHRCLMFFHQPEDREAVLRNAEKLWRVVVHYFSLRPPYPEGGESKDSTNICNKAWCIHSVGWNAFTITVSLTSTSVPKEKVAEMFRVEAEKHPVSLEQWFGIIQQCLEGKHESVAHFFDNLPTIPFDFEIAIRQRRVLQDLSEGDQSVLDSFVKQVYGAETSLSHNAFLRVNKEWKSRIQDVPPLFQTLEACPWEYLFWTHVHAQMCSPNGGGEDVPVSLDQGTFRAIIVLVSEWMCPAPWEPINSKVEKGIQMLLGM